MSEYTDQPLRTDVLVIGSGIAGLVAALRASLRARVVVVSKAALEEGCSRHAQGGIAAAVAGDDSPDLHFADTIAAGRGLCDEAAVRILVEEGPRRVRDLVEWGVAFDTHGGRLVVGREAAHSRARILHARGDATGLEVETTLVGRLRASPATVLERHRVVQLLTDDRGRCIGADVLDEEQGRLRRLLATTTILASGGAGRLWRHTTNPEPATGDGIALAYDIGAEVADLEFVQFHPTVLALPGAPRFLISEAVRGEGAHVVDDQGRRFLFDSDADGELAGRDIVARAIWDHLRRTGADYVWLDCRPLADRAALRFPTIHATCLAFGLDLRTDPVPIAPAAHYLVGGVRTDLRGATTVPGLFACGEVAATGVHGANRLASNSLLESLVFAHRAADAALQEVAEMPPPIVGTRVQEAPYEEPPADEGGRRRRSMERLRTAMWDGCGVVRDAKSLADAAAVAAEIREDAEADPALRLAGLAAAATTASLVCAAAAARRETRGCHIRSDFPETDDTWLGHWIMQRDRGARCDRNTRTND